MLTKETFLIVSHVSLWLCVLLTVAVLYYLARHVAFLYMRLGPLGARMMDSGPPIAEQAPQKSVVDANGTSVALSGTRSRLQLLLFISPGCKTCHDLAPSVRRLANASRRDLDFAIVASGARDHNLRFIKEYDLSSVTYIINDQIGLDYGIIITPYALLLDTNGRVVTKGLVNNIAHLESILNAHDVGVSSLEKLFRDQVDAELSVGSASHKKGAANVL